MACTRFVFSTMLPIAVWPTSRAWNSIDPDAFQLSGWYESQTYVFSVRFKNVWGEVSGQLGCVPAWIEMAVLDSRLPIPKHQWLTYIFFSVIQFKQRQSQCVHRKNSTDAGVNELTRFDQVEFWVVLVSAFAQTAGSEPASTNAIRKSFRSDWRVADTTGAMLLWVWGYRSSWWETLTERTRHRCPCNSTANHHDIKNLRFRLRCGGRVLRIKS